eukprot:CAMPEP_0205826554 /NCGR_PEP_ID=MMETSP0206-20130828/29040_1 /ASSEMBLY_ACC=CAM_ASM_000279 /TAXON_ID=36767 /ORGANISM="Euplotes focardii, Strain TN1" /LENGTH=132 /DNA_ID=CAMNT_0053126567 /DNA_START=303 /DNA_END=698 /DNA_ORIENTATION=+
MNKNEPKKKNESKLKKKKMVNDDLFQTQKYEVATKATTYKDTKETRYGALPEFKMADDTLKSTKTQKLKVASKYKKTIIDTLPQFADLYDESYYETEYKDSIEIKPRHISGCDGNANFQKFYNEHFVQKYTG